MTVQTEAIAKQIVKDIIATVSGPHTPPAVIQAMMNQFAYWVGQVDKLEGQVRELERVRYADPLIGKWLYVVVADENERLAQITHKIEGGYMVSLKGKKPIHMPIPTPMSVALFETDTDAEDFTQVSRGSLFRKPVD